MSRISATTKGTSSGSARTTGSATINFGSSPGTAEATIAVTGQTLLSGSSKVETWIMETTTGGNTALDHRTLAALCRVTAGTLIAGTGFTIFAYLPLGKAVGTYTIQWAWS